MVRVVAIAAVGVVFFGALSACVIPSRSVLPNERLPTTNDEAYVAIVVDVPERATLSIALCQDGDVGRCITIGPQGADDGIRVAALPPARWCLQQFLLQDGATSLDVLVERARLRCFDVAPGAVTYPGHFSLLVEHTQFSAVRMRTRFVRMRGIEGQVHAAFPSTAGLPVLVVEPAPLVPRAIDSTTTPAPAPTTNPDPDD